MADAVEEKKPKGGRRYLTCLVIVVAALIIAFDVLYPDSPGSGRRVEEAPRTDAVPVDETAPARRPSRPGDPQTMSEAEFDRLIGKGVRLVDFWATWCGPCKEQAPILEKLAKDFAGKAEIYKIDVDENPALAERFEVTAIPTLLLFRNGELIDRFVGVQDGETLAAALAEAR